MLNRKNFESSRRKRSKKRKLVKGKYKTSYAKVFPEISLRKNGIYNAEVTKDGILKTYKVAEPIYIKSIAESLTQGIIKINLSFKYKDKIKEISCTRNIFDKKGLLSLQIYGLDVNEFNVTFVLKHMINQEKIAKKSYYHDEIGWKIMGGEKIFLHHQIIGKTKFKSFYTGSINISPYGNFAEWDTMIKKEVIKHPPLELMLVLGFSSALVGLIPERIDNESLFCHIFGDSSTGKTTALMLALSVFGSPDAKNNGLFFSWNSTQNSLLAILNHNTGIVVGIDESSSSNTTDFSNIIYRIANGRDKLRLNKESELKEAGTWQTTIISNGENSLLENSNSNTGLRVRMLEFGNVDWTKSAENAEKIKQTVLMNYGFAGMIFVNELLKKDMEEINKIFEEKYNLVMKNIEDKKLKFANRVAKKVAIILTTAYFVKRIFGYDINTSKLKDFIISKASYFDEEEVELELKALNYLKEYINSNMNKFIFKSYGMYLKNDKGEEENANFEYIPRNEIIGRIEYNKDDHLFNVYVISNQLEKIFKEGGFTNSKVILKKLRDKKILDADKGRLTKKRIISELAPNGVRCYCFAFKHEFDEIVEKESTPWWKLNPSNPNSRKLIQNKMKDEEYVFEEDTGTNNENEINV